MRVLALIAARAGSKGLEHKNVRKVGGVPLLVRAIRLARRAGRPNEQWTVAVSTEDARYAKLARAAGAEVIARPPELATDTTPLIDVVLHAIADRPCDVVLLLSASTPLTRRRDVHRVLDLWREHAVAIATVCRDTPAPLRFTHGELGKLEATSDLQPGRRQLGPEHVRLSGALYAAAPDWLLHHRRFVVSGVTIGARMPTHRSLDIEDYGDLLLARALLARRRGTN